MFILDPINGITSIKFYRKVAQQSLKRSFLYLLYLSAIFTLAMVLAAKVRLAPAIVEVTDWLAQNVPQLTFADGKVTSPSPSPITLRYPKLPDVGMLIDTTRVDPVTPAIMEENKVQVYLTSNAVYLMRQPGKIEVNDLSKTPSAKPVTVDANTYREFGRIVPIIVYVSLLFVTPFAFVCWKVGATLFYSLVGLMLNAAFDANVSYASLLGVTLYAQTLVIALQTVVLFTPSVPPYFAVIALVVVGIYLALALKALKAPEQPPPAA
ncbi:MAG: DUF1189 family protein [Elusimicrobia bacterium]|nr:DUF1189 family protein [Elusimicrobiota bacterium]